MKKSFYAIATLMALSTAHAESNISAGLGYLGFYAEYEQQLANHLALSIQGATIFYTVNAGLSARYFEQPDLSGWFGAISLQSFAGLNEPAVVGQVGGGYRWKFIPQMALNLQGDFNLPITANMRGLTQGLPLTGKLGLHIYF